MSWTEFRKTMALPSPRALLSLSQRHTTYRLGACRVGRWKVDTRRTIRRRERH